MDAAHGAARGAFCRIGCRGRSRGGECRGRHYEPRSAVRLGGESRRRLRPVQAAVPRARGGRAPAAREASHSWQPRPHWRPHARRPLRRARVGRVRRQSGWRQRRARRIVRRALRGPIGGRQVTALLGVFAAGDDKRTPSETVGRRMLEAMRTRGGDVSELRSFDGAMVAASRYGWECAPDFSGDTLVLEWDGLVVAADASLYYRADLRAALGRRGIVPSGHTTAHLIAAASRAWGDDCAERLEGDFAFIVWNRKTARVCAARDFGGKRTLAYAQFGGTLVIASTVGGVLAHPECPAELNLASIAATAAGMFAAGHETAYTAIQTV